MIGKYFCAISLLLFSQLVTAAPDWFYELNHDDPEYLYGLGQGVSANEAKQQALKEIVSLLHTTVSGDTQSRLRVFNEQVERSHQQVIRTQVPPLPISGYQIIESEREGHSHYVQLKVARQTLSQGLARELTRLNTRLGQIKHTNATPIEELSRLMKEHEPLTQAVLLADAITVLNGQLPPMQAIDWASARLPTLLNQASVKVQLSGASQRLQHSFRQWLNQQGLRLNNHNSLATMTLQIQAHPTREMFSQFHRQISATLQIKDQTGVRTSKTWQLNGVSSISGQQAKTVAEQQLINTLEQQDVWALISQI